MISREDINRSALDLESSRARMERFAGLLGIVGICFVAAMSIPAALVGHAVASGWVQYVVAAVVLAVVFVPAVMVITNVAMRQGKDLDATMAQLERELTRALEAAEDEAARREVQVRRQEFETRLANALEMAEGEAEVIDVVERALASTLPTSPAELLLADNSHAHLSRMAVAAPDGEPPRCDVDSPDQCPAARRAQTQRFGDSDALDACPKLRNRARGRCSALCVPVSIMGRTVGVIHATAEPEVTFEDSAIHDLDTLANLAGARIGLLRMVADTQLQAATDSLTGLLNRRSLENKASSLRASRTPFSLVMADLDHFKELNDTHGHETGDRALRLFAQTLKASLRDHDLVSRHGGEEFAIVLPRCTPEEAEAALRLVQENLRSGLQAAGLPTLTASFGVVAGRDGEDLSTTIGRADVALFEAKHDGRDRIVVHGDQLHAIVAKRSREPSLPGEQPSNHEA